MNWYDKAMQQLEDDFMDGLISSEEFKSQVRDLNAEVDEEANQAARSVYDDYME